MEFIEELLQLSILIRKVGLVCESAMVFFRDYLPFTVTDTSLFSNKTLSSIGNGPVSCTLIYLSLVYAREQMGRRIIFDLLFPEVYDAHKQTLGYLGVSQEEFEHYWNAVHYLDASSPMHPRPKVKKDVKVYTKMNAPKSMLLFQYGQATHFTPEELRQQDNPWAYVQRKRKSIVPEGGMSADEKLFNTAGYQISREEPADVIHTIFYGNRNDSRIECAVVRSELLYTMEKTHSILVVNAFPYRRTIRCVQKARRYQNGKWTAAQKVFDLEFTTDEEFRIAMDLLFVRNPDYSSKVRYLPRYRRAFIFGIWRAAESDKCHEECMKKCESEWVHCTGRQISEGINARRQINVDDADLIHYDFMK